MTHLPGRAEVGDKIRGTYSPGVQSRQAVRTLANIGDYDGATRQGAVNQPSELTDDCGGTFDSLRCYCVGYSPIRGCALLASSSQSKSLAAGAGDSGLLNGELGGRDPPPLKLLRTGGLKLRS
jgi:hypothetical protein